VRPARERVVDPPPAEPPTPAEQAEVDAYLANGRNPVIPQ
jgi:hypothetical protein